MLMARSASKSSVPGSLVMVQLPVVGVKEPSPSLDPVSALWNSPKSPKESSKESSNDVAKEKSDAPSWDVKTVVSEKGPKPSCRRM